MANQLFRREALRAGAGPRFGDAVFYQPISLKVLLVFLVGLFLCFLLFAGLAGIKQTEPVRGYLRPVVGETKVYSVRPGIFDELHSTEGKQVRKGDLLATIADPQFDMEGNRANTILVGHLDRQITYLKTQIEVLKQKAELNVSQLRGLISGLAEELRLMTEEHGVVSDRLALAERQYQNARVLFEGGAIAGSEHDQTLSARYNLLQLSKSTLLKIENRKLALLEARQKLELLPLSLEDDLLKLQGSLSQMLARRKELETQGLFTLTAPASGVVTNLLSAAGDHVDPRTPILSIVPREAALQAQLYVPSRALGEVAVGQPIMLSYDAYPYQIFGSHAATITSIGETVMDPREFLLPVELPEPVYLVKAEIAQQKVQGDVEYQLRAGMQFSADIVTGNETVLERILSPLNSLGRKL